MLCGYHKCQVVEGLQCEECLHFLKDMRPEEMTGAQRMMLMKSMLDRKVYNQTAVYAISKLVGRQVMIPEIAYAWDRLVLESWERSGAIPPLEVTVPMLTNNGWGVSIIETICRKDTGEPVATEEHHFCPLHPMKVSS